MNDPSHTDHDRALLDDLEAEYMELVRAIDLRAIEYAQAESEEFNLSIGTTVRALLRPLNPSMSACQWEAARQDLFNVINEHVAPKWALRELPKRVAATEEMIAEWAEEGPAAPAAAAQKMIGEWAQEATAEPPEVFDDPRRPAKRAEVEYGTFAACETARDAEIETRRTL